MMIPELLLDELFPLDEVYVNEKLEDATLNEGCCGRFGGIRYKKNEDETIDILAWQCNMADVQNFDVKLPTVIRIKVGSDNLISDVSLYENFKGSQGIPCAHKYLSQRLEKIAKGIEFKSTNEVMKNPIILNCRHVYELLFGSCTFHEFCKKRNWDNAYVSENTRAYLIDEKLVCYDHISINGEKAITKIVISDFLKNIKYNSSGSVKAVEQLRFEGFELKGEEWKPIKEPQVLTAETNKDYVMGLMKIISAYWMRSGKNIGVPAKFYFSQIWAPTFYGIISQAFGLSIFNNNYAYFQHCIYGIQHKDEVPLCIGVINGIEEGEKYFDDFSVEMLY